MCGRFTLRTPAAAIVDHFAVEGEVPSLTPRYNIAPTQAVAVVRMEGEGTSPRRELAMLQWGLVPHWAKEPSIGNRMINARAETVAEKPAYRAALRRRRCLVPADGFYEWRKTDGRKQPYFIRFKDNELFAFAGLWEHWEGPDHSSIESCTLLTTEANELVRPIHDRMPVILPSEAYRLWLDPSEQDPSRLLPLLDSHSADPMQTYAVDAIVNNPRNERPECTAPL